MKDNIDMLKEMLLAQKSQADETKKLMIIIMKMQQKEIKQHQEINEYKNQQISSLEQQVNLAGNNDKDLSIDDFVDL